MKRSRLINPLLLIQILQCPLSGWSPLVSNHVPEPRDRTASASHIKIMAPNSALRVSGSATLFSESIFRDILKSHSSNR